MAMVEVAFTPLPAHVRTARLVAVAVARRSGVADSLLDEVRLAVGEACSRAVEAHRQYCPAEPVKIALTDSGGRFEVVVTDAAPGETAGLNGTTEPGAARQTPDVPAADAHPVGEVAPAGSTAARAGRPLFDAQGGLQDGSGLAVIAELADDVRISRTAAGISVCMSWPSSARER
jgi:anti-sigma regulatory factor (Ser/Thr protein kinase)